jgi:hypothetical protein
MKSAAAKRRFFLLLQFTLREDAGSPVAPRGSDF